MSPRSRPKIGDGPAAHAYVFPRHRSEIDRLDVQHYALREALGSNHLAPAAGAARVLDAGCGTGQWAFDLCAEVPGAMVVGLDLVAAKPDAPPNFRFVRGNLLTGLPFQGDAFDLVHQRLLVSGLPVKSWGSVVGELARVTRPGGWVELVEPDAGVEPSGPATTQLFDMLLRLGRTMGLDSTGTVFASLDGYLVRAGLEAVDRQQLDLPVGEWGGRVGSLVASDIRAGFARLGGAFQARFGLSSEQCDDLLLAMQQEWIERRGHWRFAIAHGRKP